MTTTHEFDEWSDLEARWACNDPEREAMDHEFNARYDRWDGFGDPDYHEDWEREAYFGAGDIADCDGCTAEDSGEPIVDSDTCNGGSGFTRSAGKAGYSDEDLPF